MLSYTRIDFYLFHSTIDLIWTPKNMKIIIQSISKKMNINKLLIII